MAEILKKTSETRENIDQKKSTNLRYLRTRMIGNYPEEEVRLRFSEDAPGKYDPIVPEHLFSQPLRCDLLVPAEKELKRIKAVLQSNTVGLDFGDTDIPKNIQIFFAALHNKGVEDMAKTDKEKAGKLIYNNPEKDLIMTPTLIIQAANFLLSQIETLPPDKRTEYTLLDYADRFLLNIAKDIAPRVKVNAKVKPKTENKSPDFLK